MSVNGEPEADIVAAMVEPITHQIAGVPTPGAIIRPVRLDKGSNHRRVPA